MIRINLLGEKVDRSATYAIQLIGFATGLVLFFAVAFFVRDSFTSTIEELSQEKTQLDKELAKLEVETKKVEELERRRRVLGEKLRTIAVLKTKKRGPVRVLDDLNMAIPERAWLTTARQKGGTLELSGIALDNQTVSLLMDNLKTYTMFSDVDLVVANEFVKDGIKLREFEIVVKLKDPIQAQIDAAKAQGKSIDGTALPSPGAPAAPVEVQKKNI